MKSRGSYFFLIIFFFLTANAQTKNSYPSLEKKISEDSLDNYLAYYSAQKDTIGLLYTHIALLDYDVSLEKRNRAIKYILKNINTLKKYNLKDYLIVKKTFTSLYYDGNDKQIKEKINELKQIAKIARSRGWADIEFSALYNIQYMSASHIVGYTYMGADTILKKFYYLSPQKTNEGKEYHTLAGNYFAFNKKNYKKSIIHFSKSYQISQQVNDVFSQKVFLLYLAQMSRYDNNIGASQSYLQKLKELFEKNKQKSDLYLIRWMHEEFAHNYEVLQQYKKATYHWKQYDLKIKELNLQERFSEPIESIRIEVIENELRSESKKALLQNEIIKQKNKSYKQLELGLTIITALSLALIVFFILWSRQRKNSLAYQKKIMFFKGQEEERDAISKELHDDIGSSLIAIRNSLPTDNQSFLSIIKNLDRIYQTIRTTSHILSNVTIHKIGLIESCQDFISLIDKNNKIEFSVFGKAITLSDDVKLITYRATQELLINALKHAEASEIKVAIYFDSKELLINVEDNGKGMPPVTKANGIGLQNIRNQLLLINGELEIKTELKQGTSVWINVPIKLVH